MKASLIGSFKSKTIWFGLILMFANWLNNNIGTIQGLIPDQYDDLVLYVIGIIVWVLRYFTREPLDKKAKSNNILDEF